MTDYIDRTAVIGKIEGTYCAGCNSYNGVMCKACAHADDISFIEDAPTENVLPVEKIGRMTALSDSEKVEVQRKTGTMFDGKCSECGAWVFDTDNFCAQCGAVLRDDTRPARRGRWRFEHGSMICTACEFEYGDDMVEMCMEAEDDHAFDFCPHCGVRMTEDGK